MIKLTIGSIDHTSALQEGTLVIRQYDTLRSSFRATLFFGETPRNLPKAGQEILVTENDDLLWGGILVETEQVCHSPQSFTMTLRGQGYEQILQRYCLPGITVNQMTPSQAVRWIFQNYLNPQDQLVLGEVEEGQSPHYTYTFSPAKASSVFDRLAKENGFVWWIDKNKTFYMKAHIPHVENRFVIDLKTSQSNGLMDIQTLVFRQSTADFKNTQFVYNRNNGVEGVSRDSERLQELANRYGGGEYGGAATNSAVVNQNQANLVAYEILNSSPGLGEIEFTTDQSGFYPGQNISVVAPVCGIKEARYFCITEINAVYFYNRFRYTVTAKETGGSALSTSRWEAMLAGDRIN